MIFVGRVNLYLVPGEAAETLGYACVRLGQGVTSPHKSPNLVQHIHGAAIQAFTTFSKLAQRCSCR